MRIISSTISTLVNASCALSPRLKTEALTIDTEQARFFEAAGSLALFSIGRTGTQLQFIGVHRAQIDLAYQLVSNADTSTQLVLISNSGYEKIGREPAMALARDLRFHVRGTSITTHRGQCIATDMTVNVNSDTAVVTFQAGPDFTEDATKLSALRQIALHEAQKHSGRHITVSAVLLGMRDITVPKNYRGPLTCIGEKWIAENAPAWITGAFELTLLENKPMVRPEGACYEPISNLNQRPGKANTWAAQPAFA